MYVCMYVCVFVCAGKEDVYKLDKDVKTKEMLKARALGIEEEQEKDFQLKVAYDVGVGEVNNEYNDDYDDQVSVSYYFITSCRNITLR